jgi:acetyltransferase-like isoleucine patch superfamily enzyme
LAGVTIESRTVVAAGAVVTKNLQGGSLYAGMPALLIKSIT